MHILPFIGALCLAVALIAAWLGMRADHASRLAEAGPPAWIEPPAAPPADDELGELSRELEALSYQTAGCLRLGGRRADLVNVYVHPEMPVFACLIHNHDEPGASVEVRLITYFEEEGQVLTTSALETAALSALAARSDPRLVQLRRAGTPGALHGQHTGSVQAWIAGGRVPLPAERDRLPSYLEADRRLYQEAHGARGLSFSQFLRALAGRPEGVLRF